MVGANIPVLEIEKFKLSKDGRGFILYEDGINAHINSISHSIIKYSGTADGWAKFHLVSGSTYGPTGAAVYFPFYRTKPTA
jgi:hypothetical protein